MRPGDSVLLRTVLGGRVRWALPQTLVEVTPERVVLFSPIGTVGRKPTEALVDNVEQFRSLDWQHVEHTWHSYHRLRLITFGSAHSVSLLWNDGWSLCAWYVDLQEPVRPSRLGYDTRDQALDVVVQPNGSWRWKDEDHLAALVELGVFSVDEAAAVRAEGERVIAAKPWPTGWEDWRPDPAWAAPELPLDWAA